MVAPSILVVEDDIALNQLLVQTLRHADYDVEGVACLAEARRYLSTHEPNLILLDCRLPDGYGMELFENGNRTLPPIVLLTAHGSVREAVSAMKAGAVEYLVKPIEIDDLELTIQRVLETITLREDYQFCKSQIEHQHCKRMVGQSESMKRVHDLIRKVAPTNMSVLIHGESGVGKELVAAEIHKQSERSHRNYVALDCCSLQEKLFESELFGHEKGAFTSADRQKEGLIKVADGGTLFLDEIGEIEPNIQAKLLRVLETKRFRRVGGTKDLSSDVRIVAATNCNLEEMSENGTFRQDLFYRLSGFVITIPPLRERREDIPELVEYFLQYHNFSRRVNKTISPTAMKELIAYDWPGNVRELKNVVERSIILASHKTQIHPEHLIFSTSNKKKKEMGFELSFDHQPTLEEIEKHYLKLLLNKYSGHRSKVAQISGVSERNIYRLIKKYGLQTTGPDYYM
ncbi:MAG: sigma-54-dependent Fis family transcriptional regulator [Thioploca sp.]|nr:sigma-54-dependent Fis family transcriptional regulator [Thioploca sp.]